MIRKIAAATIAGSTMTACVHSGAVPFQTTGSTPQLVAPSRPTSTTSVLKFLREQVVVGSTIDPKLHQLNPYGLTVAPVTAGAFRKGDLVVCNFNDKTNTQGTGYTIVALHQKPGSKTRFVSEDKTLVGCDALALAPDNTIWAAAWTANDNPVISSSGTLIVNIKGKPFDHPFGQVFAQHGSVAAFYATNARGDGAVIRINLGSTFTYDVIAKGFGVNNGAPGSILAPSGLAYDTSLDTLYVVDGVTNTVVALSSVSSIPNGGVIVGKDGKTFSGPSASHARLVYAGSPLNGPISSALLFNGNLVVGNTTNPTGKNLIVEMTPTGQILFVKNVDKGAAGAIFGMAATGTEAENTRVYFNDDNHNDLRVLER